MGVGLLVSCGVGSIPFRCCVRSYAGGRRSTPKGAFLTCARAKKGLIAMRRGSPVAAVGGKSKHMRTRHANGALILFLSRRVGRVVWGARSHRRTPTCGRQRILWSHGNKDEKSSKRRRIIDSIRSQLTDCSRPSSLCQIRGLLRLCPFSIESEQTSTPSSDDVGRANRTNTTTIARRSIDPTCPR